MVALPSNKRQATVVFGKRITVRASSLMTTRWVVVLPCDEDTSLLSSTQIALIDETIVLSTSA